MKSTIPLTVLCLAFVTNVTVAPGSDSTKPADYSAYNVKADELLRRAAETSEARYYEEAQTSIDRALALSPGNFEARKLQVRVLLGEHAYKIALARAQELNRMVPDDVAVYGYLTDAYSAFGDYKDAEGAAQWMLRLRPGNRPALINAAKLRDLFGELDGAYQLLDLAYQSTGPSERLEQAMILAKMSHVRLEGSKVDEAEKLARQAIQLDAQYAPGSLQLARVCVARKKYDEAISLLQAQYRANPESDALFALAESLELAGRESEAKNSFADYLSKTLSSSRDGRSDPDLVFYYADYAKQPEEALRVALDQYTQRKDVYTLDAYAWALHMNGNEDEARRQMDLALAVGTQDPAILRHSTAIPPQHLH